jgi:dTDP-4-amino-4,6-dideoxygalactose transaminase
MNENHLEKNISSRTKAIIPVHYAGVSCEMDIIVKIAQHHNVPIVEDNSHGFLGEYKGKQLGTFGCLAALSFHATKNFTCGEGGALLINDTKLCGRAEFIWEKGTNCLQFNRGIVDKYTWVDIGSSYLPSELLAAFLYAQLQSKDQIQKLRSRVWGYYCKNLFDWADKNRVRIPNVPDYCKHPFHLFYLIMQSVDQRNALIQHLLNHGIQAAFHFPPLHLSAMGSKYGVKGDLPITEKISDCLIRLPFYSELSEDKLIYIIDALHKFAF